MALPQRYTIRLWDTISGRELPPLNVPNSGLFTEFGGVFVGLTADGKKAATGGFGTRTLIWDTGTGKQALELKGRSNMAYAVSFSDDGNYLTVGGRTRWDLRNGRGATAVGRDFYRTTKRFQSRSRVRRCQASVSMYWVQHEILT